MTLAPGDHRLVADLAEIDDRGLEHAEDILHERRHFDQLHGYRDDRVDRALTALSMIRRLTKR